MERGLLKFIKTAVKVGGETSPPPLFLWSTTMSNQDWGGEIPNKQHCIFQRVELFNTNFHRFCSFSPQYYKVLDNQGKLVQQQAIESWWDKVKRRLGRIYMHRRQEEGGKRGLAGSLFFILENKIPLCYTSIDFIDVKAGGDFEDHQDRPQGQEVS